MYLSEGLKKKFAQLRTRADQKGQAVLEYILVLIVTVSIILGIMHQFSDAFGNFLDKYFGDYIACLLETGELPSLGGQGANQSSCQSPMQNFSLDSGKALVQSSSGNGGGSGGSDSAPTKNDGGSDSTSSSRGPSRSRPRTVTRSGGTANGDGQTANTKKGRPGRFNQKLNSSKGDDKSKNVGFNGSGGRGVGPDGKVIRRKRIIYLGDDYLSEDEKKKKKQATLNESREKKKGDVNQLRTPLMKLEIKKTRNVSSQEEEKGFNFSVFIKFLLIAGIIIAIVIFLGGQGMQIKKSWQKSE